MGKFESFTKMLESENGPVIAGVGGIVLLVGGHYLTKRNYKVEAKNDKKSLTVAPVVAAEESAEETEE